MKKKFPKLAVLILNYNQKQYLRGLFESLNNQGYKEFSTYFVDNNSDDGSLNYVKKNYIDVHIIKNEENYGYAKGNNIGLKEIFSKSFDLCFLVNPDIIFDKDAIINLLNTYINCKKENIKVGLIQPVILLNDKPKKINTIGNCTHYLGFGYCKNYLDDYKKIDKDKKIVSASGASVLIPKDFYLNVGAFDEDFFMYNEDQDLSWRGLIRNYTHFLSVASIVFHDYKFYKNNSKLYLSERNRLIMLIKNYSFKYLLLLSPVFLFNEASVLIYFTFNGWLGLKIKSYVYVISHLREIIKKRNIIQKKRLTDDRDIISKFESNLDSKVFNNAIIRYLYNPLNNVLFKLIIKGT